MGTQTHVRRDDLRHWARANLDSELGKCQYSPGLAFALVHQAEQHADFLVASRDGGKDVFSAARVIMALVRATRARLTEVDRSEVVVRDSQDDQAWREQLAAACRSIEVNPEIMDRLAVSVHGLCFG